MKITTRIASFTLLILFIFSSCRKDNNSLNGFVTFNHPTTDVEYAATLATVSLYKDSKEKTGDIATYSTTVDEFGKYKFPRVFKGKYEMEIIFNFESNFYDTVFEMTFKNRDDLTLDVLLNP